MTTALRVYKSRLPVDNLTAYFARVNAIPFLTEKEEQDLATEYQATGDLAAAKRMVMAHLRFVIKIARQYSGYGLQELDLIQEGNVGLMKAVKRFDPTRGVRLVSFAVHWIKAEMHEFIIKNWRIVKVATTKAQRKLFFNLRSMKKQLTWFKQTQVDDVAEKLNVKPEIVREMESRMYAHDESFSAPTDADDSTAAFSPEQYLADTTMNPESLLMNSDSEQDAKARLMAAFSDLDDRSKAILQRRWFDDEKATLQDLAAEYKVSAERVRQIERQAMDKIKALMTEDAAA
jgi:RNA polymerase sigma-32 factor